MEKVCDFFKDKEISYIFCSDLRRSIESAKILGSFLKRTPVVKSWLREIDTGDFTGKSFSFIFSKNRDLISKIFNDPQVRFPNGESICELLNRVYPNFIKVLESLSGSVVFVGHGGPNRIIICKAVGIPIKNMMRIGQDFGSITVLEYFDDGYFYLKLLNFKP